MRCKRCAGSGFYLDFGMMRVECDCDELTSRDKPVALDRRSKAYKEAIDKIVKTNKCSRDEAIKVFDSEFQKIA